MNSIQASCFYLRADHRSARIRILSDASGALLEKTIGILPYRSWLHYTKISGEGLYLFVPFFVPPENITHVSKLTRGAVAYWPNRQLLLIYYGKFEKEDAGIMLLGMIDEDLDQITELGEQVKIRQRQPVLLTL